MGPLALLFVPVPAIGAYLWAKFAQGGGGDGGSFITTRTAIAPPTDHATLPGVTVGPATAVTSQPSPLALPVSTTQAAPFVDAAARAREEQAANAARAMIESNAAQQQADTLKAQAAEQARQALAAREAQSQAEAQQAQLQAQAQESAANEARLRAEAAQQQQLAQQAADEGARKEHEAVALRQKQAADQEAAMRATRERELAAARDKAAAAAQAAEQQAQAAVKTATQQQAVQQHASAQKETAKAHANAALDASKAGQQKRTALYEGAIALQRFLNAHPTREAFGYRGRPSAEVRGFQKIAGLTADGILGPDVRAAGASVNVVFPQRPSELAGPAPRPIQQQQATPAPGPVVTIHEAQIKPNTPVLTNTGPAGFNLELARSLAPRVATDVRSKKYDYSRDLMKQFQLAAGLTADGAYGGGTRGALVYFGQNAAPKPLFKPTQTQSYRPPGAQPQANV